MESMDRAEYARRFRDSQKLIVTATQNRQRYLQQMACCIEDCQAAVEQARRLQPQVTFAARDSGELQQTHANLAGQLTLSLIVFGRSNTGKSTLLNQILHQWPDANDSALFPTAGHNCTARVAIVCYGPSQEIRLLSMGDGPAAVLKQRTFQRAKSISDFMDLNRTREDFDEELKKLVEIKVPHPLLRDGLRVVDSPGMGESQPMNDIVRSFLSQLKSGIIIYVVDGMEGYKPNPDTENIKFLMEQSSALQKLIVANRIDFDFSAWYTNLSEEYPLWDLDDDPIQEVLEGLNDSIGFDYTAQCESYTANRIASVRQQVENNHLEGRTAEHMVIGVSAKSVKDFIANQQKLSHAPYVDSFLHLESRIAELVYENGRQHLLDAAMKAKQALVQTKTLSMNFYCDQTERSSEMIRLLEKSISTIHDIFRHISDSLDGILDCDSLDLSNGGSDLNRLKAQFVREDVSPEQHVIDTSLMMRDTEAKFVDSLIKASSGSKEAKMAIRLLCDFKDAVVSRLRTILMWNYKMIFMVEANKPLSKLDTECKKLLDSLKSQSSQIDSNKACEDVVILVRSQMFSPDPSMFDKVCTRVLTESMRQALGAAIRRDEFRRITDSLPVVSKCSVEDRSRVLSYFMDNVDFTQQISRIISEYRQQLKDQMLFLDNLLSALLQNLREQGTRTRDELRAMRSHNETMSAMIFYIDALITEANWTADFEISLHEFQAQCSDMTFKISPSRHRRLMKPRFAQQIQQPGAGWTGDLQYRLIKVQQDDARRLASDVAQVKSRLAQSVNLSWLSLTDTYHSHMREPEVHLLIGFHGDYACLAELAPTSLSDTVRLALLRRLVNCWAEMIGLSHRPTDYRPSCVLLRRQQPDEVASNDAIISHDDLVMVAHDAFPDPTRMSTAVGEATSLAACAVSLFNHAGREKNDDAVTEVAVDPHGWDARHAKELQLVAGDRVRYLANMRRRLVEPGRSESIVSGVSHCIRACLEAADAEIADGASTDDKPSSALIKCIQEAKMALQAAGASTSS